ncbi:MAG: dTDP-4-dehydrorhamnose 3,5-epimerase [Deltaproteobacteria bacterium]|nr:dTDP-4-dehydrorhamnose 3,5-epimerase [Deltaproteobacteria bacterium]
MKFIPVPLAGAFVLEVERHDDERGGFGRTYCARELAAQGLDPRIAQCSMSWNTSRGTLRGMHYQASPHEEAKTVRVVAGAIFDVMVDLRPGSPTRGQWFGAELSASNHRALYIPAGFAHGFLTMSDQSVVHYQISDFYVPEASRGFRWDDPSVAIAWPFPPTCISDRDRALPGLDV